MIIIQLELKLIKHLLIYKFNTYSAAYNGLNDFKLYNGTNPLGFNAFVDYSITTKQGFVLEIRSYLIIEKSGNSWVIKGIL